jgi:hypothetical protein
VLRNISPTVSRRKRDLYPGHYILKGYKAMLCKEEDYRITRFPETGGKEG